jgi:hypothetical protein
MGTKARPSQLRPHNAVTGFRAAQARKAARETAGTGRWAQYRWPADRAAIIDEIMAGQSSRRRAACE